MKNRAGLTSGGAVWRVAALSGCTLLFCVAGSAASTATCKPQGEVEIELKVTPGELSGAGNQLRVAVFANDCVFVRLPDHYRRRGDYVLALTAAERAQLEVSSRDHLAQPYELAV